MDRTHDGKVIRMLTVIAEFTAHAVREWLGKVGAKTFYIIEPGSPWENGYNESFCTSSRRCNGKLRNELLDGEIFYTLQEAKVLIER